MIQVKGHLSQFLSISTTPACTCSCLSQYITLLLYSLLLPLCLKTGLFFQPFLPVVTLTSTPPHSLLVGPGRGSPSRPVAVQCGTLLWSTPTASITVLPHLFWPIQTSPSYTPCLYLCPPFPVPCTSP